MQRMPRGGFSMRALIAICLLLYAGNVFAQESNVPKLKVAATFSIIGDLVKNVGGNKVDVGVLVGPNGDVHTFEPTPTENLLFLEAKVIFVNGMNLEPWLEALRQTSATTAPLV